MKPYTFVTEHRPSARIVFQGDPFLATVRFVVSIDDVPYAIADTRKKAWAAAQARLEFELKINDTVIFDLDGTLANIDVRREFCRTSSGKINFKKFYDPENISMDTPNAPVVEMAKILRAAGKRIVIFSGRSKETEAETIKFLKACGVKYDMMIMRPTDVAHLYTPDSQLKATWLKTYFPGSEKERIMCVYDDRDKVVNMWRHNGVPCFQVNEGDF
jgi:hypothetical protein